MPETHNFDKLRLPKNAPFELKPSTLDRWGVFATKPIKQSDRFLVEEPLFVLDVPEGPGMGKAIAEAVMGLKGDKIRQFSCLRNPKLALNESILRAVGPNRIGLWYHGAMKDGVFAIATRFNHSCIPNSVCPTTNKDLVIREATRDIQPGEEITLNYNPDCQAMTRSERHLNLGFVCTCKACDVGTLFQQASDMRRVFIRVLNYMTFNIDPKWMFERSVQSLIIDPKLRKRSAEGHLPLSSMLIYQVLVLFLLEQEGLLSDNRAKMAETGIYSTIRQFRNKCNVKIAKRVMKKKTWLGRVSVAFQLYGRDDAADAVAVPAIQRAYEESLKR